MAGYVFRGPDKGPVRGRPARPYDPDACGTDQGVQQHRRAGEPGCEKCRAFYNAKRRAARRAA